MNRRISSLFTFVLLLITANMSTSGVEYDFGDASDPNYPTLQSSNGARHMIVPGFNMGGMVDGELDGLPAYDARGDDNDGTDDEDGVTFVTLLMPGQQAAVEVIVTSAGFLDAWIDFNSDGNWTQTKDRIFQSKFLSTGRNILSFQVPSDAVIGVDTYARFRFSSTGVPAPYGPAPDGEVEDYHILLGKAGPCVSGEELLPHVTWSQAPIEADSSADSPRPFCGWSEPARSTEHSGSTRQWRMDADDFRCPGDTPVTQIKWWGSYKAWRYTELPESRPYAWHIDFWANMVEGLEPEELFPERIVWSLEIPLDRIQAKPVGYTEFPGKTTDMCFVYEVLLGPNEWFCPAEFTSNDDIFWISITAIYPVDAAAVNMWGWMTRPGVWGSGAVMPAIMGDWPTFDERLFPGRVYPIENGLLCGENQAYDMCFELLTEQSRVKRDQPFSGISRSDECVNNVSMASEPNGGDMLMLQQAADDWMCDSNDPVIAIAWNGCYAGYAYDPCGCDKSNLPLRPDYFLLSIFANEEPAGLIDFNHPGEKVWEYKAYDYDEVLVGYNKYPFTGPDDCEPALDGEFLCCEPNEPVFRYSVRLPGQDWFVQEDVNNLNWLSIAAVYQDSDVEIPYSWKWLNREHAFDNPSLWIDYTSPLQPAWEPVTDSEARPYDMSFTLYTGPDPNALKGL